jgi:hypothetical protein
VLHRSEPASESTATKRRGYTQLDTDVDETEAALARDSTDAERSAEGADTERDVVRTQGWSALIWSFVASSAMTVSVI